MVRCNRISNPMQIECNIMQSPACGCWGNFPNLDGDTLDDADTDADDDCNDDGDDGKWNDEDDDDDEEVVVRRSP